jgi:chloramphenicol 3-O phosphotransferase
MMAMSCVALRTGQVIFLNGTSSSGKSSVAEQLLLVLDRPFFHMSVDAINSMRSRKRTLELGPDELANVLARTRAGFHRAVAGMAEAGNDLVVDYVLSERWRLLDCSFSRSRRMPSLRASYRRPRSSGLGERYDHSM